MLTRLVVPAFVTVVLLGFTQPAFADPTKCKQGISKASAKYVQGRTKVFQKCEEAKAKGQLPPATVCASDPKTVAVVGVLNGKLAASIASACGGGDTCPGAEGLLLTDQARAQTRGFFNYVASS